MSTKRKKVKQNDALEKDVFSKAIINVDHRAYKSHKKRKQLLKQKEERLISLEKDVIELREMISNLINNNR